MISVNGDIKNNRVIVKIFGKISDKDISVGAKRFMDTCQKLGDNFTIINDLSGLHEESEKLLGVLASLSAKTQEVFKVAKIIRVVGNSASLLLLLNRLDKKNNLQNIYYVPTIQKAISVQMTD